MTFVAHLSPDAGWPELKRFLAQTTSRLTVGMYDFTAPHIVEAVKAAVKSSQRRFNLVIQSGSATGGDAKKDDIPDEQVVETFKTLLRARFKHAWASVSGPSRLFASAYHIKVAVRNGRAFWLSSGNWQSSNQPEIDPAGADEMTWNPLRKFNREWHAVVENHTLAGQFEAFLLHDLEEASKAAPEAAGPAAPSIYLPLEYFDDEHFEPEAAARPRYFDPLVVRRRLRVMPLLTPDNYRGAILKLIEGARSRLYFQNQSLCILDNDEAGYLDLLDALKRKQSEGVERADRHPGRLQPAARSGADERLRLRHGRRAGPKEVPHEGHRHRLCPRGAGKPQLDQPRHARQPGCEPDHLRRRNRPVL